MSLDAPSGMELAAYPDEEGFLLRPVAAGKIDYVELDRTNLDLWHFAQVNDMLDVEQYNRAVIEEANRRATAPRG